MRGEHMRTDGNGRRAAAFLRWQGADWANEFASILIRQWDVRQQNLGPDRPQDAEALGGRGCHGCLGTVRVENDPDDLERVAIVVYNQYSSIPQLSVQCTSSIPEYAEKGARSWTAIRLEA